MLSTPGRCSVPACPRPTAPAANWMSLASFGIAGVGHEKCVRRLYKLRARRKPLDTPVRGASEAPVPPCSSVDCEDPDGGYRKHATSRPIRLTVEGRPYCRTCGNRVLGRLKAGIDPDAPLKGSEADEGDPDDAATATLGVLAHDCEVMAAAINDLLASLPPPDLDVLSGPAFTAALLAAWRDRRWGMVLGRPERSLAEMFG